MLSEEKEDDPEALGSSNYRWSLEPEPGCSSCTPGILTRVPSGCPASQGWLLLYLGGFIEFYPLIHGFSHSKKPHSSTFGGLHIPWDREHSLVWDALALPFPANVAFIPNCARSHPFGGLWHQFTSKGLFGLFSWL